MGSRKIRIGLLAVVIVAAAGTLLGAGSPQVPTNVAYVSEEEGGVSVIDLSTLKVIRKSDTSDLDPRGLAVTFDGKYVITSNKNLIEVELNGEKITRMDTDEWPKPNLRPDGSRHKFDIAYKDHPRKGYIGLQDHGSPCWFKNIKIRPLK